MADIGNLNVRVGLDSTGFQQEVSKLNTEMKRVQSGFRAASAEVGKHGSELEQLKTKSNALTQQTDLQRQKLAALESAHKKSAELKGEDAKATVDLEIKLNQAKATLSNMQHDLEAVNQKIATQSSSWYALGKSLEPIGQSMTEIGTKMEGVGKSLSTKLTVPILGLGAAVTKIGSDFEAEMSKVQAISGATGDELVALTEKAKEMGQNTKFSASEAAAALNYMAMAGWETDQMLDGISGVMALAASSGEDLAMVSDIVTDALTAFGMEAADAGDFADLLANTASNANTNVALMGETFKHVAPLFGALGFSAEDASLAIGLMGNAGIKGSAAGTTLKSALANLANPADKAAAAMETLGIKLTDSGGNMLSFEQIMGDLRTSFSDLTQEQQAQYAATMFGRQAMSGMLAIINASEEDYQKLTEATRNYSGAADEMAKIMEDNLQGQLTILRSQLEGVAIQVYEILVPHLRSMVETLQRAVEWFSNLSPSMQELIVKVAAFAAALGPILIVGGKLTAGVGSIITLFSKASVAVAGHIAALGGVNLASKAAAISGQALIAVKTGLSTAFTLLTGPIGLVVLAISGLVAIGALLYTNWDTVKESAEKLGVAISTTWQSVKEHTTAAWDSLKTTISGGWEMMKDSTVGAVSTITEVVGEKWDAIREAVTGKWEPAKEKLSSIWEGMKETTASSLERVSDTVSSSWTAIQEKSTGALETLKIGIASSWDMLKDEAETSWQTLSESVSSAWDRTLQNTGAVLGSIVGTIGSGWDNVNLSTDAKWALMTNALFHYWDRLQDQASLSFSGLRDIVQRAFENVQTTLGSSLENIAAIIQKGWDWVVKHTIGAWSTVYESLKNTTQGIVENIKSYVQNIKNALEKVVDYVLKPFRKIRDGLNSLKGDIQNALNYLNPFAKHSPSLVEQVEAGSAKIDQTYRKLAGSVKKSVSGMYDGLSEGPSLEGALSGFALLGAADGAGQVLDEFSLSAKGGALASGQLEEAVDTLPDTLSNLTREMEPFKGNVQSLGSVFDGLEESALATYRFATPLIDAFDGITKAIRRGVESVKDWNGLGVLEKSANFAVSGLNASVPKHFSGTSFFPGGLTMVGELGPELVELPRGSRIYSDHETRKIATETPSTGGDFTLKIDTFINNRKQDIEELAYELEFYRQRMALGKGRI